MTILRHSFSSLAQFDDCPKKFWHLRIAKDVKDTPFDASSEGNRVHEAFEKRIRDKVPLPENLIKHEPKVLALELSGGTITAEEEFAFTKDFKPTGWWADDVWLRIKNDVTVVGSRIAAVFDWKTGKRRPKPFQLELGALPIFLRHPHIEKVNAAFIWLQQNTTDKEEYTRDDADKIIDKVKEKAERIEVALKEEVWQAKPGPLCKFCPARNICSYAPPEAKRYS
jgi:CRISPR/Cas system-associated exonuclease Cas4 (RecB family)